MNPEDRLQAVLQELFALDPTIENSRLVGDDLPITKATFIQLRALRSFPCAMRIDQPPVDAAIRLTDQETHI
jgi:hypothetical protein